MHRRKGSGQPFRFIMPKSILFVYLFSLVSAYPNLQVAGIVYLKLY